MRVPGAEELLEASARGAREGASERSVRIARLGWPDAEPSSDTPGERNARCLELRRALLGRRVACVAECPACGELLDVDLDVDQLLAVQGEAGGRSVEVEWHGERLRFRVPSVADVEDVSRGARDDDATAAARLAERCLEQGRWPAAETEALVRELSMQLECRDPLGCVAIALACPSCGAESAPAADPAALLWQEVEDAAGRLIGEVHQLASAYGWSEREILALPAARRNRYLALVCG